MKRVYEENTVIAPSACDSTGRLGIPDTFALFMDIATAHADLLGCGLRQLAKRNLFWLTVRTRVKFYRRPAMTESVTISTFPEDAGKLRCNRDYRITQGGETLCEGKTEWAILETDTGKLHSAADVYPSDLEAAVAPVWDEPFSRIGEDFSGAELLGEYTVKSTDIDLGGHMNNTAYIRAIASLFSAKAWQALHVCELEAVYRAQAFEGQVLRVFRRDTEAFLDLQMVNEQAQTVFLARITHKGATR